ncbi:hypothetical protein LEP1GSC040_0295 [Leptospira santarosai str. 2000030832]|nr:hypothetical protein LEP1GSC040_0295 [Leptospira santarosai str. 2000030832]
MGIRWIRACHFFERTVEFGTKFVESEKSPEAGLYYILCFLEKCSELVPKETLRS